MVLYLNAFARLLTKLELSNRTTKLVDLNESSSSHCTIYLETHIVQKSNENLQI